LNVRYLVRTIADLFLYFCFDDTRLKLRRRIERIVEDVTKYFDCLFDSRGRNRDYNKSTRP
jgi:hypothetical protein